LQIKGISPHWRDDRELIIKQDRAISSYNITMADLPICQSIECQPTNASVVLKKEARRDVMLGYVSEKGS